MANEAHHYTSECCGLPCALDGSYVAYAEQGNVASAQQFFARLADSIRPPHVGEERRNFVKELLLRAEEANLYKPGVP